jgi:ribose 5-phosphate isomerase B
VIAVPDKDRIEQMVRRVVHRTLGLGGGIKRTPSRPMVTERDINEIPFRGEFVVPKGALITPLARQVAMDRKVKLIEAGDAPKPSVFSARPTTVTSQGKQSVAIGADHGGYELKEAVKIYLGELGFTVIDCGTDSKQSVDYPDFAFAVAQLVGRGKAWRGIVIDGAGIGSCMVANKVPGVRASMCYDQATAVNSREHNDANILCLGAGMIGSNLARQIVKIWLDTSFAGGRHARRVDKMMEIEQRFLR